MEGCDVVRGGARTLLTVAIDALVVIAIALAIRQVIVFSGAVSHQSWAAAYAALVSHLVIPFGFPNIKTPYGGTFDVDNAATIILVVAAEWGLSIFADRS